MKAIIITVAGLSSRFSASVGKPVVKCIYHEGTEENTLLARLLRQSESFDEIVVVVGYRGDEVASYIADVCPEAIGKKTVVATNEEYATYGSGWSLLIGLNALRKGHFDTIVFAEGDLFLDDETFGKICSGDSDALTVNQMPVMSDKSVALYINAENKPCYIYDTSHDLLSINEPFRAVYSSGQVWRFGDVERLYRAVDAVTEEEHQGTNLVLVNEYFHNCDTNKLDIECFKTWLNCNTVDDYRQAFE